MKLKVMFLFACLFLSIGIVTMPEFTSHFFVYTY